MEGTMLKRLTTLLAALLMLTFVVTGCGDDNESDSGGGGDTAADTVTTDDSAGGTTESDKTTSGETETEKDDTSADDDSTSSGGASAPPEISDDQIERCKDGVAKAKQLSDDAKSTIRDLCEKAGSSDVDERREAAHEVCRTLVGESIPKDSPQREQSLKNCDKIGGQ
jgi:hypothetical protein